MGLKVVVDYDLCEANARCMEVCPEVFQVDDDDNLNLLIESPPASLRAKLKEAERVCPRQAITIVEE
jgi:ferredoxin